VLQHRAQRSKAHAEHGSRENARRS
jgi:hypothetical protein